MKSVRLSPVSLVVGLVLAVTALWGGATPIGISGDLVAGGWTTCSSPEGTLACTNGGSSGLNPCQGTFIRYCYENPTCGADGASIVVAIDQPGQPGLTMHAAASTPCTYNGWCTGIHSGRCY